MVVDTRPTTLETSLPARVLNSVEPKTLRKLVAARIRRSRGDVFVPADFDDLGGNVQINRVLRGLVADRTIARLGRGIYARLRRNPLTGQPMLAAEGGFDGAVRQTLRKLRVQWDETQVVRDYNAGLTTQVQANSAFAVRGRFSRRLRYKELEAQFERARG